MWQKESDGNGDPIRVLEPWYSASDLSRKFGHTHQYWSRLLREGKIEARKTSSGFITTHTWLLASGFINKKKKTNGSSK